jgi:hypothetical protein
MIAKKKLKRSYRVYRGIVIYPLKRVKIEADRISRPSGNCFVYRYIVDDLLCEYISKENYAEQLIINQTVSQILQGIC